MQVIHSARFEKQYATAPAEVQKAFDKQQRLLLTNPRHPSLRAKKFNKTINLWQARVTRSWRFYFTIEDHTYYLHSLREHPK